MWSRETEEAQQGMMFTREKSKDIGAVETLRYFSPFLSRFLPPMDNHPCAKIHSKIRYRRYLHVIWGYLYHSLLRSHLMDGIYLSRISIEEWVAWSFHIFHCYFYVNLHQIISFPSIFTFIRNKLRKYRCSKDIKSINSNRWSIISFRNLEKRKNCSIILYLLKFLYISI